MSEINDGLRPDSEGTVCAFDGCDRPVRAKKLCWGHYQQLRRGGELTPLRPRRSADTNGLRAALRVRDSGFDTSVVAGLARMHHVEVADWVVTRSPSGNDGPKVARTFACDDSLRAYWYDSYLGYAPPEEFALASRLVHDAILERYPRPHPIYFEQATITQSMETEEESNDGKSV